MGQRDRRGGELPGIIVGTEQAPAGAQKLIEAARADYRLQALPGEEALDD